ncbi:OmpA family protein [Elioraea sp.]|uniref:OmpA family protein n=1 Tax=Elioraea sp. TaxID=2185103 RepID=UPI003F72F0B8
MLVALSACGPSLNPIEAARVLTGRTPTTDLPPVPGADQPYPSLGTVPERPVPPPAEQRRRIADALIADRENARHAGPPVMPPPVGVAPPASPQAVPLTAPAAAPFGTSGDQPVPGMVAPMVAPPARVVPPIAGAPEPRPPGPPAAPPSVAGPPETAPAAAPPPAELAPAAPPPRAAAPAAAPASAPPRTDPSVVVDRTALPPLRATQAAALPAGQGAALAFPPGSAALSPDARAVAARFAAGRGAATVRVTGYRDSAGGDLGLALARAQAVAQALRSAGTPADAIELAAEPRPGPAGRGAEMRLVYSP